MISILSMSSASPDGPPPEDLTTQARIRNVAIAHFVRDGFQKANMRAIAADAGVSIGLIFHHFGSKAGLRDACDEYVLRVQTRRAHAAGRPEMVQGLLGEYLSSPGEYQLLVQYLGRAIQEDSPVATSIVDMMVTESEEILRAGVADGTMHPSSDPRAQAVLGIVFSMAVLTMPPALARALGHEKFGPEVLRRLSAPTLELFTRGLYTDETLLKNAEKAWRQQPVEEDGNT
ncbi:transcriptional regulator, TetR family [Saccharopolyspora shandongensis]|uniref:Transcriptional regulator, TetR family n=2 Tax=Saccharopolyspora shandongensis TaxID=418495 RepID=A0A1H3N8K1_9PSEU|nr:transcriptional regulator, TetR family [Saccharopolyspora shandongensis]